MNKYSVFVGGVEVNDYSLALEKARELADRYRLDGYDDVFVWKAEEAE